MLLARYDAQLRAETEVADADEVQRLGPLWMATFPKRARGFLSYQNLAGHDVDELMRGAIEHYAADERIDHFEWKTRGHDWPADLLERLASHGFVLEDRETVMVGSTAAVIAADPGVPTGYELAKATTEEELRAAEALAGRVFGDTVEQSTRFADELVDCWNRDPESFEMWLVREQSGEVVCSGRVDFVNGTEFAGLWGAACDAEHRGRGLYRAITAERARRAEARGKTYLQSDCTEFSQPILQRAGLVPITTTTPAVWRRA